MLGLKKFVLLRRRADIDRATFSRYWIEHHGPKVAEQPEFWRYTARYIQNHLIDETDAPFDGVATSTQADRANANGSFTDEPCYRDIIRPDEQRFLDQNNLGSILAHEAIRIDRGSGPAKLMVFVRRNTLDEIEHARKLWEATSQTAVRRLIISSCLPGTASARIDGSVLPSFDGVIEIWGNSTEALLADRLLSDITVDRWRLVVPVREFEITRPRDTP